MKGGVAKCKIKPRVWNRNETPKNCNSSIWFILIHRFFYFSHTWYRRTGFYCIIMIFLRQQLISLFILFCAILGFIIWKIVLVIFYYRDIVLRYDYKKYLRYVFFGNIRFSKLSYKLFILVHVIFIYFFFEQFHFYMFRLCK